MRVRSLPCWLPRFSALAAVSLDGPPSQRHMQFAGLNRSHGGRRELHYFDDPAYLGLDMPFLFFGFVFEKRRAWNGLGCRAVPVGEPIQVVTHLPEGTGSGAFSIRTTILLKWQPFFLFLFECFNQIRKQITGITEVLLNEIL